MINRRDAMKLGAAAFAGIAAPLPAFEGGEGDPFRGLKVGVHSYSLRKFDLTRTIETVASFGVGYIGLKSMHLPLDSSKETLAAAKAQINNAGLEILACGVVTFDDDEDTARQAFEYAKAMGMPVIVANPKTDKSLDILNDLVQEYRIKIAIHNHGPAGTFAVPGDVLKTFEGRHEYIGACADLGHYERANIPAEVAVKALRERLYDIHLKDVDRREEKAENRILGQGIINLEAVFDLLLEMKFDGHVAMEYESEPDDPSESMRKGFEYVRQLLAGKD